ncbi:MAG: glycosyltransferase, partial [Gammaproteobacteria bacterium]|nr:glycosyltransferase [Gammaproteobacteria bacterium]
MKRPLFSIVIANFNHGQFLGSAIESVLAQSCQDFELIVVDGGSSDNSVEVIEDYSPRISWWVSEPDSGQSDA